MSERGIRWTIIPNRGLSSHFATLWLLKKINSGNENAVNQIFPDKACFLPLMRHGAKPSRSIFFRFSIAFPIYIRYHLSQAGYFRLLLLLSVSFRAGLSRLFLSIFCSFLQGTNVKDEYSVREVADMVRMDRTAVFRWIKAGKLKAYQTPGGTYRILHRHLAAVFKKYGIPMGYIDRLSPGPRVLIVDDDAEISGILEKRLKRKGFETKAARSGIEAGILIKNFRPHIALLDNVFSPDEGKDLCRLIREDPELRAMKLISISGKPRSGKKAKDRDLTLFFKNRLTWMK